MQHEPSSSLEEISSWLNGPYWVSELTSNHVVWTRWKCCRKSVLLARCCVTQWNLCRRYWTQTEIRRCYYYTDNSQDNEILQHLLTRDFNKCWTSWVAAQCKHEDTFFLGFSSTGGCGGCSAAGASSFFSISGSVFSSVVSASDFFSSPFGNCKDTFHLMSYSSQLGLCRHLKFHYTKIQPAMRLFSILLFKIPSYAGK